MSFWTLLKLTYWPLFLCFADRRDKKVKKMVDKGEEKLTKALNARTLIRMEQAFATVLRLEYGKAARQMLQL